MARLITPLEQHLDRMPPTVVTQATTWWETVLALVKLQEIGLGVHLPVKVCYWWVIPLVSKAHNYTQETWQYVFGPCMLSRHKSIWKGMTIQTGPRVGFYSGWLVHGSQFSNCNITLTWLTEVGVTIKSKWGIVASYIVLCNCITILLRMSSTACKLYIGHRSMVFICRSVVEHFNCKWSLYSVSADHAYDNCVCQRVTEDCQKKQSDRDQGIAYHQRIPKLSGRR